MAMRSGYAVTIKGFVGVNSKDLAEHANVLGAIAKAQNSTEPDANDLFALMKVDLFEVKPVSRRAEVEKKDAAK